jgi:hypothetical protein
MNNLDSLLQMCSETYGGTGDNILFLIDDCANQKDAKVKTCELTRLTSPRHIGLVYHKYNAVVKDFRDNIRALVQYYEKDEDSLKATLSENGVIPKEQRQGVVERLKWGRKSKLVMRFEHPYMWWIIDLVELSLKLVLWLYIVIFIRKIYHIVCNMVNTQKVLDEALAELGLEDADDKPSDTCGSIAVV